MPEQNNKNTDPYMAERYLMAAFNKGEWIPAEYKCASTECRQNPKAFCELYLCACDRVPIELVRMAIANEPMEANLRKVREQYLEKKYRDTQHSIINELAELVDTLQTKVISITDAQKLLKEDVDEIDEMFAQEPSAEQKGKSMDDASENLRFLEKEREEFEKTEVTSSKILKSGDRKNGNVFSFLFKKRFSATALLNELYKNDYSKEQIDYVVECIEEGLNEKEIRTFISPKLDVDTMKRLRRIYVKGETGNGKR